MDDKLTHKSQDALSTAIRAAAADGSPQVDPLQLLAFERQHLSPAVVAARGAGDVRGDGASALRTLVQARGMPPVRCFARP